MLATLAPESLSLIFTHLDKSELLSLSLVSFKVSSVARLFLYQSVTLRASKPSHQATIQLLLRDNVIAKRIENLILVSQSVASFPQQAGWFPVEVLEKTTALHSLELVGLPFVSPEEQSDFTRLLRACPLREWVLRLPHGPVWGPIEFPAPTLEIPGLERLTWDLPGLYFLCFSNANH
ncbi:hypothetical protein BDQ17DRAFT_194056 [Cyathus striatus]|nr:hypothetical protein BDQ17DRAFT_194056 [Cyathus striatus]